MSDQFDRFESDSVVGTPDGGVGVFDRVVGI